jgi:hypothetical protein
MFGRSKDDQKDGQCKGTEMTKTVGVVVGRMEKAGYMQNIVKQ